MRTRLLISTLLFSAFITSSVTAADLQINSPDVTEGKQLDNAQVFQGFGCEGGNLSPSVSWDNAPEGTESFAVTLYDPDAPTGSGWWHWFAFNIPADVTELPGGESLPDGAIELVNDYGVRGFGGACPPPGEVHRYQLTVHALPGMLEIDGSVSNALAGFMVQANSLASSTITAVYSR